MKSESRNQRIVLASRPEGAPSQSNFRLEELDVPNIEDGQVLLGIKYLSLDPYMRGRMDDRKSYSDPVRIGDVMEGGTVAEVLQTRHPGFAAGEYVLSHSGWQRFAISDGEGLRILDPKAAPISTALGVLGMPAFAAYVGLTTIGTPRPGETVVVAAASGAVGSAVGQMARAMGARVVGIAGGPEKCAYIRDELRFDDAIDHRTGDFRRQLSKSCPNGIDVYFENVGGAVWDAVHPLLNTFARVPVCGLVAHLNDVPDRPHRSTDQLTAVMLDISVKSLRVQGFVQLDYPHLWNEFQHKAVKWFSNGDLRHKEDIIDGLANAPDAFIGLLRGQNFGKVVMRVD